MNVLNTSEITDRRREPRLDYSGFIFFATENHGCEGVLRNFSRSGLFIESSEGVEVGDRITIALPYFDDKRIGLIVWRNHAGFGVKLGAGTHAGNQGARPASRFYRRISSRVLRLFRGDD